MVPFSKFLERMSEEVPKYSFIWSWLPPGETEEGRGEIAWVEGSTISRGGYRTPFCDIGDYPIIKITYRRSVVSKRRMKILTE